MNALPALPAELTIYTVGEWHPHGLGWAAAEDDADALVLDAAAVQEVDAAGVQLLLSLERALARRERRLRLAHASAPLVTACTTLGVAHLIADAAPEVAR